MQKPYKTGDISVLYSHDHFVKGHVFSFSLMQLSNQLIPRQLAQKSRRATSKSEISQQVHVAPLKLINYA